MHVWKRQGERFISLPFARIDQAGLFFFEQKGGGSPPTAPPSARVPSSEKVKGGGEGRLATVLLPLFDLPPSFSKKETWLRTPNGERGRIG